MLKDRYMIKNYSILFFLWLNLVASSQPKKVLNADSLINLFENNDVFIVLDKLNLYQIDYLDCYNNSKINSYVLKWLDFDINFNHDMDKVISKAFNEEYKINKVKGWLKKNNLGYMEDTVLKTSRLFDMYLDSVYKDFINEKKINYIKNGCSLKEKALLFFMKYRIPEAYTIIRKYWDMQGNSLESPYFNVMLAMHDSIAIMAYSNYLDKIVENRDYFMLRREMQRVVNEYDYGSVCVDFKLRLLKETFIVPRLLLDLGDGSGIDCPLNLVLLYPYIFDYYFYNSTNPIVLNIVESLYSLKTKNGFPIEKMSIDELRLISEKVIDNYPEFMKVANEHKLKLQQQEEYWKVNMPFFK